jgi:hypothetical protein
MALSDVLLRQQMQETEANYQRVADDETARQKKGGFFSSMGGGVGGLLGGLGAKALAGALGVATGGLAMPLLIGGGAALGTLAGARVGADLGGGRRHDAVKLGQNVDALTGKTKNFSKAIQDRYQKGVNQFQENLNTQILSQAVNTGLKAGAFAAANPLLQQKGYLKEQFRGGMNKLKGELGFGTPTPMGGVQTGLPTPATPNLAGASAYQPAGLEPNFAPAEAFKQATTSSDLAQGPTMTGGGFLSNPPAADMTLSTAPMSTAPVGNINMPSMSTAPVSTTAVQPNNLLNLTQGSEMPDFIMGNNAIPAPNVPSQSYIDSIRKGDMMRRQGFRLPPTLGGQPIPTQQASFAMQQPTIPVY